MRVTIGQINTTNGDYEGNVARILSAIEHAKRDKSDLVVFPEVTIQGYTSFDWFLDPDVARSALDPLNEIIEATSGITAIVGTVRPSDEPTGRRLFNSAAVIRDRKLLGFADKTLLPEYDVFDDPRGCLAPHAGCPREDPALRCGLALPFVKTFGMTRRSGDNDCILTIRRRN
jgi:NAD+ synthase (glutamine-hydrolysing)